MTDAPETTGPPPVRELVKDGKWCIPVEQRPRDWREIEEKLKANGKKAAKV